MPNKNLIVTLKDNLRDVVKLATIEEIYSEFGDVDAPLILEGFDPQYSIVH